MGDANPIRTLGDYSKPSHEGYRNTIELPLGNNVVPLRSDTIRLVQNGCSFHGLWSEDPNQHLKDFLKLLDSLDLDGENREITLTYIMDEIHVRLNILRLTISPEVCSFMLCDLDFEPLSLSFSSRSLNLIPCLFCRLFHLAILCFDQRSHTMPHLESFKSELAEVFVFKS
ncbi:hypothetical protein Tco_1392111 [Tanacetum coccineum]